MSFPRLSETKYRTVSAEKSCRAPKQSALKAVWAGFKFLCSGREKDFRVNRVEAEDKARRVFAALLREPFPDWTDTEIAREWSERLQRSDRQVRNWLNEESTASFTDGYIVGTMHGVWDAARIVVGEETRADVLKQIGQRNG